MRVLVLGTGMMGYAAAFDLAYNDEVKTITLADINKKKLLDAENMINQSILETQLLDASNKQKLFGIMDDHDAVVGAISYALNYELASAAIEVGTNFCDLGGHASIVSQLMVQEKTIKGALSPEKA